MNRILSLFDCPLRDVKRFLPIISAQGFNIVQVSPLQRVKDEGSNEWYLLYQPLGFEIGNRIGTKEELYDLCLEARKYGIHIVVDAVINHVANKSAEEFLEPHPDADSDLLKDRDCFKEKIQISDWNDRNQVIHYCLGLPGLNPNNPLVQRKIINMLNEYIALGVDGFRFDAAKSIALPDEGCYFFPNVTKALSKPIYIVYGEVLFPGKGLIERYAKHMKVLTNYDAYERDSIIKFIENKDSFLSKDLGYTKTWPKERITGEYLDLASQYPNTLYYARNYTDDWHEWQSNDVRDANKRLVKKR